MLGQRRGRKRVEVDRSRVDEVDHRLELLARVRREQLCIDAGQHRERGEWACRLSGHSPGYRTPTWARISSSTRAIPAVVAPRHHRALHQSGREAPVHFLDLEPQALTLPRCVDALLAGRRAHHEMVGAVHEGGEVDHAGGARDARGARERRADRRLHHAEPIVGVLEHCGDVFVDSGGADVTARDDRFHRSEHELAEVDRVDAEIEQCATALREVEVAMGGDHLGTPTKARLDEERLADARVIEQVTQRSVGRKEARPHGFHEEALLRFGSRDHLVRLRRVERERLLAEHVLAGGEEQQRVGRMTRMRRGDVHGIDVGVVGERLVAAAAIARCRIALRMPLHARAIANRPRPPCRRRSRACPRRTASRSRPGRRCPSESPVAPHVSPWSAAFDPRRWLEPMQGNPCIRGLRPSYDRRTSPARSAGRRSQGGWDAQVARDGRRRGRARGGPDRRRIDGVDSSGGERGVEGRDQDRDHVSGSRCDPQRHQHEPW